VGVGVTVGPVAAILIRQLRSPPPAHHGQFVVVLRVLKEALTDSSQVFPIILQGVRSTLTP
jgi:hypothetical protein